MAVLEIKKYPEEVLRRKAAPVKGMDDALQHLIDDMIETMYAAPGVGLAAPQVGVSKRLIVIDVSVRESKQPLIVLVNPQIVEADGFEEFEEGCLSVPEYTAVITRAERIKVKGLDRDGVSVEIEAAGLLARALQHEIDHLDGVLFIDRLSSIKREFFKKRYRKTLRELHAGT